MKNCFQDPFPSWAWMIQRLRRKLQWRKPARISSIFSRRKLLAWWHRKSQLNMNIYEKPTAANEHGAVVFQTRLQTGVADGMWLDFSAGRQNYRFPLLRIAPNASSPPLDGHRLDKIRVRTTKYPDWIDAQSFIRSEPTSRQWSL